MCQTPFPGQDLCRHYGSLSDSVLTSPTPLPASPWLSSSSGLLNFRFRSVYFIISYCSGFFCTTCHSCDQLICSWISCTGFHQWINGNPIPHRNTDSMDHTNHLCKRQNRQLVNNCWVYKWNSDPQIPFCAMG